MKTQERLTVQDLAMFIGAKCLIEENICEIVSVCSDFNTVTCRNEKWRSVRNEYAWESFDVEYIKPILRPLSDMTEEEGIEIAKLVSYRLQRGLEPLHFKFVKKNKGCDEIKVSFNNSPGYTNFTISISNDGVCYSEKDGNLGQRDYYTPNQYKLTQYLISKHFDIFGWIEAGLAIDSTKQ